LLLALTMAPAEGRNVRNKLFSIEHFVKLKKLHIHHFSKDSDNFFYVCMISDVARPLSYKTTYFFMTKTTFSIPRPLF